MSTGVGLKTSASRQLSFNMSNRDLRGLRNRAPSSTDDKPLEIIGSPPLGSRHMENFVPHSWLYFEQDPLDSKEAGPCPPQFEEQMAEVKNILREEALVNADRLDHEVEWYYSATGLGLDKHYFERNSAQEIAEHIGSLYSAKALAHMSGAGLELQLADRRKGKAMFIVRSTPGSNSSPSARVEQRIDADYLGEGYRHSTDNRAGEKRFRVECYRTRGTVSSNNSIHLRLYLLTELKFKNPEAGPTDLNFDEIADFNFLSNTNEARLDIYRDLVAAAVNQLGPVIRVLDMNGDKFEKNLLIAYRSGTTHSFFSAVTHLYHSFHLYSTAKYVNHFANGITVFSFFLLPRKPENALTEQTKQQLVEEVNMIYILPRTSISDLFIQGHLTAKEYAYTYAAWKFAFHFLSRQSVEFATLSSAFKDDPNAAQMLAAIRTVVQREAYTEGRIMEPLFDYPELIKDLYRNFERRFFRVGGGTLAEIGVGINDADDDALLAKVDRVVSSELDRQIFRKILQFNQHIVKTNFFKTNKIALSFRLDPKFIPQREYPVTPFALFFVVGPEFRGFHLRFRDVARGGIRIIRSTNFQTFLQNVTTVFDENYNLASTQERKNKDIAEGGSKGTILLSVDHQDKAQIAFSKYVDSLLDLLLPDPDIVDYYGQQELLFLGPDEGTAHYMDWASQHAKSRGYKFWKSFTTGKSQTLGGIPHDTFGMTTRSVHQYVLGTLEKLGLNEADCTKFQTGGPDGDLGSNEIKISLDKTVGIVDGSGVLFDPNGLDKQELLRLAELRQMSENFEVSKLSSRGFFCSVKDTDRTLPDGTVVSKGLDFRNSFHLSTMASADIFVPCGGRPEAVNMSNVSMLIDDATKRPRFKYIIEGANLFFTQEARLYLEKKGVIMFKDASANKGGVTSSSLEVLTALAMNDAEFEEHMMVKGGVTPSFYASYIEDVHHKIEENAQLEFNALWAEHERTGTPRSVLSDQISNKINELSKAIETSDLWFNMELRRKVLAETCPRSLLNLLGLETILERVPENYARAMFGCFLASRYVYKCGLAQIPEFAFYNFMGSYLLQLLSPKITQ